MISKIYSDVCVIFKDEEDLNKKGVIYCLTFENGKTYIGQTVKELNQRIAQHCCIKSGCRKVKNAIQKYKTFSVSILSSKLDINQMNLFEQMFIKMLNSNGIDGYNLESGGKNKKHSNETKRKMSESKRGKTFSDEHKRKLSESKKRISDDTRRKMSESKKCISDDTRRKMSESKKGMKYSDETKTKMSKSNNGKHKDKNTKKIKSIPDNIIFNSIKECSAFYNIRTCDITRYYNGRTHRRTGQTFVLLEGAES